MKCWFSITDTIDFILAFGKTHTIGWFRFMGRIWLLEWGQPLEIKYEKLYENCPIDGIAHLQSENYKNLPFEELFEVPFQYAYNVDHPGTGMRAEPERRQ